MGWGEGAVLSLPGCLHQEPLEGAGPSAQHCAVATDPAQWLHPGPWCCAGAALRPACGWNVSPRSTRCYGQGLIGDESGEELVPGAPGCLVLPDCSLLCVPQEGPAEIFFFFFSLCGDLLLSKDEVGGSHAGVSEHPGLS